MDRRSGQDGAEERRVPTYVDVFAGCGGLSLGLERSGWRGLFAVEKDRYAFETLSANFLDPECRHTFDWPVWLEQRPWTVEHLLAEHRGRLTAMRGQVDLLAGGPPCQGFSSAGRRRADDPRNSMVERYLELVEAIEPNMLLLENVRGFTLDFKTGTPRSKHGSENAAARLIRSLSANYNVASAMLKASDFGVPQNRPRFIMMAVRRGFGAANDLLAGLGAVRDEVLERRGLNATTSARDALSDLEVGRNPLVACSDSPGFEAIGYMTPATAFQLAMHDGLGRAPSDTRLAKHSGPVRERFADIIDLCREEGRSTRTLSQEMRDHFRMRKLATRVLDPDKPSPTVTSMPDDLIHYSEPRTLTVRETARLQTFPDWFEFKGKYTSGGHLRRVEVPRFTQVANAVPPLLAEILGERLRVAWDALRQAAQPRSSTTVS